jgi:hypothetical protein
MVLSNILKNSILLFFRIFIHMRPLLKDEDKRVKVSITLTPEINKKMEKDLTNKSKLIERLLREYYGKKNL